MPSRVHTGLRRAEHASIKVHSARLASKQFPINEELQEEITPVPLENVEENDDGDSLGTECSDLVSL